MSFDDLQRVLKLQNMAYGLLLWLNRQAAAQPDLLDDEHVGELRTSAGCEAWLRRVHGSLPTDLRPSAADMTACAHLLAAFFNTSFRVEEWLRRGRRIRQLVPGVHAERGRREKRRRAPTVRALERLAVESLATSAGLSTSRERIDAVVTNESLQQDLDLWAYACELARRSEFASQGPAVHAMWRSIDADTRKGLTADVVWAARERLLGALAIGQESS